MNPASSVAQSIFLFLLVGLHCFKVWEISKTTQKRASNPHVKNALVCYFTYLHWITHDSDKNIEPTNPKPSEGWDQLSKDIMEKHLALIQTLVQSWPSYGFFDDATTERITWRFSSNINGSENLTTLALGFLVVSYSRTIHQAQVERNN